MSRLPGGLGPGGGPARCLEGRLTWQIAPMSGRFHETSTIVWLVMLYETNPEFDWSHAQVAPANALDWREGVDTFENVALSSEFVDEVTLVRDDRPVLIGVSAVSGNFFSVLGVRPELGRAFEWEETRDGDDDVVLLGHAAWGDHFGADPDVVGRTAQLGTVRVQVVGVMPRGFDFPSGRTQIWTPRGCERVS